MRRLLKHKSILCFLLILSLVIPLLPSFKSNAEYTGVLDQPIIVENAPHGSYPVHREIPVQEVSALPSNSVEIWRTSKSTSIDYYITERGNGSTDGSISCYYDIDTNSFYYVTETNGSIKYIFKDIDSSDYIMLTAVQYNKTLNAYVKRTDNMKNVKGFSTLPKCSNATGLGGFENDNYTLQAQGLNEIIKDPDADKWHVAYALCLLGLKPENFNQIKYKDLEDEYSTYKILDNCVLIDNANSKNIHESLTISDVSGEARLMYGSLDITDKLSRDEHCIYKSILDTIEASNIAHKEYSKELQQVATDEEMSSYKSVYDYYAARLANYSINGTTEVRDELNNFPNTPEALQNLGNLTAEEKLRLIVFANILSKSSTDNNQYMLKYIQSRSEWRWSSTNISGQVNIAENTSAHSLADLVDGAESLYKGRYSEYSAVASPTEELELTNAYAVAMYYAAVMYGAETKVNDVQGYRDIHKCDYIESVTMKLNDSIKLQNNNFSGKNEDGEDTYFGIPPMTRINFIADTEDARNAYYNLNQLLVIIANYCNDNKDQYSTSEWYKTLKSVSDPANIANTDAYSTLKDNLSKVQAAININKTLSFLGVEFSWIPAVQTVCDAGNVLSVYDNIVVDMNEAYEANDEEPMRTFFNLSTGKLSDDYIKGVALSATYKPMSTNMYDIKSVSFMEDTEWVTRFHYPWGFYRKALYIDTDSNAAVNRYVTSSKAKGSTRIATLGDLLEPEKDIVLYIDDRFYNVDKLAEKMNFVYTKVQNTSTEESSLEDADKKDSVGFFESIGSGIMEVFDMDIESIVKTGGNSSYSRSVYDNVKHTNDDEDKLFSIAEYTILSPENIDYELRGYSDDPTDEYAKQYSVLQSYAVVSSIYRDTSLYSTVTSLTGKSPAVFVSSPKLFAMEGVSQSDFNTIYNYAMLKNLKDILPIDYKSQLDLSEPLYMDIYGNILTDSGLVVIPAISNATLCSSDYSPATVGFMYLYNYGSYHIPANANNCDFMLSNYFVADENTGSYKLANKIFNNVKINLSKVQLNDEGVIQLFYECAIDNCYLTGYLPFNNHVYWITEILRGAPLEFIDKDREMITTTTTYSKLGISIASKLDEVVSAFYSGDTKLSILSLPNLAFMNGFEYVILYLFKIVFVALFLLLVYRLYTDAVSGTLGVKSVVSFIASVVMFLITCFAVPTLLDVSYYQVNKKLLQGESLQTVMLDAEKKAEGREIGITGVQEVSNDSKLYLKVDDLSVPWYAILDDVLFNNTVDTLDSLYQEEFSSSPLANLPRFERQGQNLYIDVNEIMNNSVITYDTSEKAIYSMVAETPYESYITPYYIVLDTLVAKINNYNLQNNINSFDTKVMSGGQVKTVGLITPYLTSNEFMLNSQDASGFKDVYGVDSTYLETSIISDEIRSKMAGSYWYTDINDYKEEVLYSLFEEIDNEAKHFVSEHRSLLNKISDEAFLEAMALDIACKHNSVFRIGNADTIEIFDVDTTDIIRMSVAPMSKVTAQCSKSFARFIYDNGGTFGTVSVAFLLFVYIIGSVLKPVCLAIMIVCLFMSVVIRKLVKKDNDSAIEGYMITMAIMCIANVLFSLIFKASLFLPDLGLSITAAALLQIAMQILYIFALISLTTIVVKDWRNAGYDTYVTSMYRLSARVGEGIIHTGNQIVNSTSTEIRNRFDSHRNDNRESRNEEKSNKQTYDPYSSDASVDAIINSMIENDEERSRHARRR